MFKIILRHKTLKVSQKYRKKSKFGICKTGFGLHHNHGTGNVDFLVRKVVGFHTYTN
jgi:hypothetical protein